MKENRLTSMQQKAHLVKTILFVLKKLIWCHFCELTKHKLGSFHFLSIFFFFHCMHKTVSTACLFSHARSNALICSQFSRWWTWARLLGMARESAGNRNNQSIYWYLKDILRPVYKAIFGASFALIFATIALRQYH